MCSWQHRSAPVGLVLRGSSSLIISRDKLRLPQLPRQFWVEERDSFKQDMATSGPPGKTQADGGQVRDSTFNQVLELLTHIFREEDDKERSDQVINSLDIPTGRMSDGPDKENSFKDLGRRERKGV